MRSLLLALALAVGGHASANDVLGTITILEGPALIYRAVGRLQAAEGVRLAAGDIVETAASTFAQIELPDRTVAQLGPSTRLMFNDSTTRQKQERTLYVMDGWIKLSSAKRDNAAGPAFELRSASFEIAAPASVVVLRSTPAETQLFVESGEARVVERSEKSERSERASPAPLTLRGGDFYQRKPPARGVVSQKAAPEFLAAMPRGYRDSLPARLERFRDRAVTPKEASAFAYADVEAWLKAEPAVRKPLMQRWRSKARESAFRAALIANLGSHREWDPILFPEKYRPPPPPPPPQAARAPASAPSPSP